MKRLILSLLILLSAFGAEAQQSIKFNPLRILYPVAIGKGNETNPDPAAFLDIGNDTSRQGILLPRVMLENMIATNKRGNFVYSLTDSSLYVFHGSKLTRIQDYRDTGMVKVIISRHVEKGNTEVTNLVLAALADSTGDVREYIVAGDASTLSVLRDTTSQLRSYILAADNAVRNAITDTAAVLRSYINAAKNAAINATADSMATARANFLNKYAPDGSATVEVNNTGFKLLRGGITMPYLPVTSYAGEWFAPIAGFNYPYVTYSNAKFRGGFVNNLASLLDYDGVENIVRYGSAVFIYDPTLPHVPNANDQVRYFTNTGKNPDVGGWILVGNNVTYAEWYYEPYSANPSWFDAVQRATSAAGEGGIVIYPDNTVIEQNRPLYTAANQTHLMQGSTLKLRKPEHVKLAAVAPVGATALKVTGTIPAHWGPGTSIAFFFGPTQYDGDNGPQTYIDHISADSIYLTYPVATTRYGGTPWQVGDYVTNPFNMIAEGDFPVTFSNGTFDGSSETTDTVSYVYTHWTVSNHSQARFENVHFRNVIGDVLLGHRIKAINCTFDNINGSILHTSGTFDASYNYEPNLLQNCDGRNIGLKAPEFSGHQEGKGAVVTHSATPGNYVIDNCRFYGQNSQIPAPIGSFNYGYASDDIAAPQDVLIKNSYFEGWESIVYKYGGTDAGAFTAATPGYTKVDRIYFLNNVFHNMDTSDYSDQEFFGDTSKIGVVKFAGNILTGNTQLKLCPATSYSYMQAEAPLSITGDKITHGTSGVTPGTYNTVTVNDKGHVTSGSNTEYLTGAGDNNFFAQYDATGVGLKASILANISNVYVKVFGGLMVNDWINAGYLQTGMWQIVTSNYRWEVGGKVSESTGNAGTDFVWDAFADDGSYLGRWMTLKRATGDLSVKGNITIEGIPSFVDDEAAEAAGLPVNSLYRVGKSVRIITAD